MASYKIEINNKRIYDYYTQNPNVNIETMNLILLNFIESISNDMTKVMQNTMHLQIINEIKEVKCQISNLQESLMNKLFEYNKSFIETTKMIITVTSSESNEKISSFLQRNLDSFIDKISILIPKTHDDIDKKIQEYISNIHKNILFDIQQLLINKNDSSLKDFISNFETKIMNLQQPLFSMINSNHEQLSSKILSINSDLSTSKQSTDKLYFEMTDYLSKYKSSSQFKGQCSEIELGKLLNDMYKSDKILNMSSTPESGDFILERDGKKYIMFETKSYTSNVDTQEVLKFLNDSKKTNLHSIMMSQTSGIVGKPDYTIEITNSGKVLVYITDVNFSCDKIRNAVDIINNLSPKLEKIYGGTKDDTITINKEVLEKINQQYNDFIESKNKLKDIIKEQNKQLNNQVDLMVMPDLSQFLKITYGNIEKKNLYCSICGYGCDNRTQLANHQRTHKNSVLENTSLSESKYSKLSLLELKIECEKRSIKNLTGKKKDELVDILNKHDTN